MSKPRRILTDAEHAYLREAWADEQVKVPVICQRLGICEDTVRRLAKAAGLGCKAGYSGAWTSANIAELKRLFLAGHGPNEIAEQLQMTRLQVTGKLHRIYGCSRPGSVVQSIALPPEKLARLRRVAAWDAAAAKGLAVYEALGVAA